MTITLENLDEYGIGHNYSDIIYPQDFENIVYGADLDEQSVIEDPTTSDGTTPWWKEPSFDRWWKVGPRGSRD